MLLAKIYSTTTSLSDPMIRRRKGGGSELYGLESKHGFWQTKEQIEMGKRLKRIEELREQRKLRDLGKEVWDER